MKKIFMVNGIIIVYIMITSCIQYASAEVADEKFASDIIKFSSEKDPRKRIKLLIELAETASPYQRFIMLPKLAKTSIELENFINAEEYADELLNMANSYQNDWNYGNAIHDANIVLGMVSLHNNSIEEAKNFLIKAGKAPASPQLKTFGPNVILADALLERGEKKIVIDYFKLLKKIWTHDEGRLDSWISSIKGGGKPYFGANLFY